MSHTLSIREKDEALKFLRKELKSGSHIGAGLTIDIQIGGGYARSDRCIRFELSVGTEELLQAAAAGLEAGRKLRLSMAKGDHSELTELLRKEGLL